MKKIFAPIIVLGVIAVLIGANSVYTVAETQQALLLQFGEVKTVKQDPGLNFKLPWQNVVYFDKRVLVFDSEPEEVIVGDQKRLVVDAVTRYEIVDPLKFYQRVRTEAGLNQRLSSVLDASLRQALGDVAVADVISERRNEIMDAIAQDSRQRSLDLGIEIIDVRIVRADLPIQNSQAVVQRMIAERNREAAEERAEGQKTKEEIESRADRDRTIILADAQKQSEILRGDGEAERNRIFADAFSRDPEFFEFYRSMQAYRESLNNEDTTLILSPEGDFFDYFQSDQGK